MARFFVDGVEVDESTYVAEHTARFKEPPQDTSGTGILHIGDLPESEKGSFDNPVEDPEL